MQKMEDYKKMYYELFNKITDGKIKENTVKC